MMYFSQFAGKDCILTGKELETALRKSFGNSVTKDQVKALVKQYGQDKDPNVSFSEFYAMYKDYVAHNSEDPTKGGGVPTDGTLNEKESSLAEKAWNGLDTSGDGFVDNKEFTKKFEDILTRMKKQGTSSSNLIEQLHQYFTYFAGKDGKLSHTEYLKMMEMMKHKVGPPTFDQFLDTLTMQDCSQLHDCYKCVAADMSCAWIPNGSQRFAQKTAGTCIESKQSALLDSIMLRGAPVGSSNSYTTTSQCGKAYDPMPHIYDGIMPPGAIIN